MSHRKMRLTQELMQQKKKSVRLSPVTSMQDIICRKRERILRNSAQNVWEQIADYNNGETTTAQNFRNAG